MADAPPAPKEPELHFPVPFGRYTLKKRLGEGGMGEVFLATMRGGIEGVEKTCVIKKLRRMYSHDQEFVTRFLDEARLMVQLSHNNIVPVFDAGELDGDYFLAMELVDGADLKELTEAAIRRKESLPASVSLYIIREILGALGYAHRKKDAQGKPFGLVHRDISPQNILCSLSGEVKLIDFGLAKSTQKVLKTDPRVVLGKYAYMSPEQARGQPVDGRSDLFAVGLLLFELLTNRKLFDGVTVGELMEQIAEHRVFAPSKVQKGIDPEVDALVNKALLKDVEKRFQTAEEFRDAVSRILTRVAPTISADDLGREVRRARGIALTGIHVLRHDEPTQGMTVAAPDDETTQPGAPDEDSGPDALKPRSTAVVRTRTASVVSKANANPAVEKDKDDDVHRQGSEPGAADPKQLPAAQTPLWKLLALAFGVVLLVVGLGVGIWFAVKGRGDGAPTTVETLPKTDPAPGTSGEEKTEPVKGTEVKKDEPRPVPEKKQEKASKKKKKKKGH